MKKYITFLLILLCSIQLVAQNRAIDSLTQLYDATTNTSEKIVLKCKISQGYTEIGDFNSGGKFAEEALKEASDINDQKGIGLANYTLARLNQYMRDWDKALIYHYQAAQFFDEADSHEELAWAYLNMGIAFHAKNDYTRGITYANKALEIFNKIEHKQGIAYTYLNLGLIMHDNGSSDTAMTKLLEAKKICTDIGDTRGIGYVHNIMGDIFLNTGKLDEALTENLDCIKIREKENDKRDLSICYGRIGNIYVKQDLSEKAEEALATGEKMGLEINAELALKNIYLTWSQLDSLKGNYQNAYIHFKKYSHYATILSNQENERNVAAINYAFKKEQEEREQESSNTNNEKDKKNSAVLSDSKNIQFALLATGSAIIILLVILLFKQAKKH